MNKQEIINRLAANTAACWIMWEIRNLKDTFEEPDDFEIKMNGVYKGKNGSGHSMADVTENMVNSLMKLIGIYSENGDQDYEYYDIFDTLEIAHAKDKDGVNIFIIS